MLAEGRGCSARLSTASLPAKGCALTSTWAETAPLLVTKQPQTYARASPMLPKNALSHARKAERAAEAE